MAGLVAIVLIISLAAIGLSIVTYNASESTMTDLMSTAEKKKNILIWLEAVNRLAISVQAEIILLFQAIYSNINHLGYVFST